jgi:hypothetical protein
MILIFNRCRFTEEREGEHAEKVHKFGRIFYDSRKRSSLPQWHEKKGIFKM